MKRHGLTALTLLVAALVLPAAALAKGAESAKVDGPGLNAGITLKGSGEPGSSSSLGQLADLAGFFPAAFGQAPDPMLARRPAGTTLGPRYTIAWVMPGPGGIRSTIRQDLYPYARPDPLTYMKPGQPFWGREHTRGGWFVAPFGLKSTLIGVGLPPTAPSGDDGFMPGLSTIGAIALAAGTLLALTLGVVRLRRRPGPLAAG